MKSKTSNIILVITTILLFLLVTAYGVIGSWQNAKSITEGYKTGITLKETVVLDNEHIIAQYGEHVTLEAGTEGEISTQSISTLKSMNISISEQVFLLMKVKR